IININYDVHNLIIFNFFFFLALFSVSSTFNEIIPILDTSMVVFLITFIYIAIYFLNNRSVKINNFEANTLLLFVIPIFLSLIGMLTAVISENNSEYMQYVTSKFPTRIILVIINIGILDRKSDV